MKLNFSLVSAYNSASALERPLVTAARVLVSQLFLIAGLRKGLHFSGTIVLFKILGAPAPVIAVLLAIAVEINGGIALFVGWRAQLASICLALFTVGATLMAHRFWSADANHFGAQLIQFTKNVAIIGGLLMLAAHVPLKRRGMQVD